jgi:hypothetical protein
LETEKRTATNFCKPLFRLNQSMDRSRRRTGSCEFFGRLL